MAAQREWFETDYYKVLGVPEGASQKDITRAYRKLAKENHPDAHPGREERFKEISAAYDVLGDAERRTEYDEVRRLGPVGGGFGPGAGGFGNGGSFRVEDLGDLFGGLFGRGAQRRTRGTGPQRGADLEASLHLGFDEAVKGITTTVNLVSEATCSVCYGSGAAVPTSPRTCPTCEGRGVVQDDQGPFSLSSPCPTCAGRGVVIDKPCSNCGGRGLERRPRTVKVRIPAGVESGQRIRMKERGEPGRNGGPPGDLYVTVEVARHPLFGRRGKDITIKVPVTFPEAALGADIQVPTLDGDAVTLRLQPGTRSGRTLRVKGRGVPSSPPGDLLVTVEVHVPATLSEAERAAVEELAAATRSTPRDHLEV